MPSPSFYNKIRGVAERLMLDKEMKVLRRTLTYDGSVDVESWVEDTELGPVKCRITPLIRRPDDKQYANMPISFADSQVNYPTTVTLNAEDRIDCNGKVYIVRLPFDQVDTYATYKAYIIAAPINQE